MTVRGRMVLAGAWLFVAALWCGMLAFFGAFGARTVLSTAPSRHAAGAVNRAVAAIASLFVITPEMMALRDRMGAIDLVAKTDPLRREWGRLHGLSSLTLVVRLGAAIGAFVAAFSQLPKGED
jgi:hypothetical protein